VDVFAFYYGRIIDRTGIDGKASAFPESVNKGKQHRSGVGFLIHLL
jgi:hypothetical protein